MAKGKHATALFEVIHSASRPPKASPTGGIGVPRWWFKGRAAKEPAPTAPRLVIESEPEPADEPEQHYSEPANADAPIVLVKTAHEIRLTLSYAGAAAAGFIVIVLVAIAYLMGSRSNQVSL